MSTPTVAGIYIAPEEGAPVVAVEEVRAVPGKGLEGDRYFKQALEESEHAPNEEITLIASEGLERARLQDGLELDPGEHRRNIVTRDIDLNGLVGVEFHVGEVLVRGLELNPPCRYLAELTGKPLLKPLINDGGVRGEILSGGTIRVGDELRVATAKPA